MTDLEEIIRLREQAVQDLLAEQDRLRREQEALLARMATINESLRRLGHVASLPSPSSSRVHRRPSKQTYTVDDYLAEKPGALVEAYRALERRILAIGEDVNQVPHKWFIAFLTDRNFCGICVLKTKLVIYLNVPVASLEDPKHIVEDCSKVGRWPSGESRFPVNSVNEVDYAMSLIRQAYEYNRRG